MSVLPPSVGTGSAPGEPLPLPPGMNAIHMAVRDGFVSAMELLVEHAGVVDVPTLPQVRHNSQHAMRAHTRTHTHTNAHVLCLCACECDVCVTCVFVGVTSVSLCPPGCLCWVERSLRICFLLSQ